MKNRVRELYFRRWLNYFAPYNGKRITRDVVQVPVWQLEPTQATEIQTYIALSLPVGRAVEKSGKQTR